MAAFPAMTGRSGSTMRALATIAADDSASDEVLKEYREVIALNSHSANPGGHAWSLATYADIERQRGGLTEARTACAQALSEAATLSDPQFAIYTGFMCAQLEIDAGNDEAARAALNDVIRRVGESGDTVYRDDSLMTLAQIDMDGGHWQAASERLRRAAEGFAAGEVETGGADAQAMLALCDQALGRAADRDQAVARARKLRQGITSRREVFIVDIELARLDGGTRQGNSAPERLLALAADAERRQWLVWSLEAKLMAWELLRARGSSAAPAMRSDIERSAHEHDLGRILKRLQRAGGVKA